MNVRRICLWVFFLLVFLLSFNISFAQTASPSSQPEVNYELPYPGLLPDSPLYFLRIIRDKTVEFLISDPLKKTEFDLLQADKRLNAGIYLFNKGKISLALSTISKAENYFEQAIAKMGEAKKEGRNVNDIEGKLKQASKKHQEELDKLIKKVDKNFQASFKKEQKRVVNFEQGLNQ